MEGSLVASNRSLSPPPRPTRWIASAHSDIYKTGHCPGRSRVLDQIPTSRTATEQRARFLVAASLEPSFSVQRLWPPLTHLSTHNVGHRRCALNGKRKSDAFSIPHIPFSSHPIRHGVSHSLEEMLWLLHSRSQASGIAAVCCIADLSNLLSGTRGNEFSRAD